MKNRILSSSRTAILATTVSSLALLAACSTNYQDFREAIKGRREPQVAGGPHRVPELNPQVQLVPQQKEMAAPPVVQQPVEEMPAPRVVPSAQNPYDNYDINGNPVGPKAAAQQNTPAPQGNFFSRMFAKEPASAPAAAPSGNAPTPLLGEPRKLIPGNPHYSDETTQVVPLPPGPESTAPVAPQETAPTSQVVMPPDAQLAMAEPQMEAAPVETLDTAPSEPRSSWFSRTFKKIKSPFESHKVPPPESRPTSAADASEPYPQLSSVPPTPEQFSVVKAERSQQLEELQSDHMQAQSDKQALDSEPSQFDVVKPVEPPALAKSVPPVNVQPVAKTAEAAPPASGNEPQLLGHVSDSQMAPVKESVVTAPAAPAVLAATPAIVQPPILPEPQEARKESPAPVEQMEEKIAQPEPAATEPPKETAETAKRHPYWWEGWNVFSKKKAAEPAQEPSEPVAAAPIEPPPPPAAQAVLAQEPRPLVEPVVPQAPAAALPELTPPPPAVAEAEPVEAAPAAAPAASSSLPSPAILQQVKMLPPSRYTLRNQAYEHPEENQQ